VFHFEVFFLFIWPSPVFRLRSPVFAHILPTRQGGEVNEPLLRIDANELHVNAIADLKVALARRIQFAFDDRALQPDPGALRRP
jgi:hypothetical protein